MSVWRFGEISSPTGAGKQGSCRNQYVMLAAHRLLASFVEWQLPAAQHNLPQLKRLLHQSANGLVLSFVTEPEFLLAR